MKISTRTIQRLGQIITGDKHISAYRTGPQLVRFFNELGFNDEYGHDFGSRWQYTENKIRECNGTANLRQIILAALDPRDYISGKTTVRETGEVISINIDAAASYLNEFLLYDGFELVKDKHFYDVRSKGGVQIPFELKLDPDHLSQEFILEQIEKCRTKISKSDYDGAITNARSLVEAVLIAIESEFVSLPDDYDGDIQRLYKRVSKHLKLSIEETQVVDDNLKQIMRGFVNIVGGLSGISNKMGDRHARKYKPSAHHAHLISNAAMTLCSFLFDTLEYQKSKRA